MDPKHIQRLYDRMLQKQKAKPMNPYSQFSYSDPFGAPTPKKVAKNSPDLVAGKGSIVRCIAAPGGREGGGYHNGKVFMITQDLYKKGSAMGKTSSTDGLRYDIAWPENGNAGVYVENITVISHHGGSAPTKGKPKPKFDLKELERLVVSDLVMGEIKAVLKQHDHSKKMFEEWGLGEVIEYGRGMTFLFYGPPGTGKTWAAKCMAKVFGKDLLSIGAAEIQTSEPGGANRNIQTAFAEAKKAGKILFLDECDSLITARNDVGMILGGEISTLLTEIEKTDGVVILATNRIESLDEALERRISLIVEFPEPDFEQRQRIWEVLLPAKLPLAKVITPKLLAEYKLTGGQIKNVLLQSARLALSAGADKVEVGHIEAAVERIIKSKSLMGTASRYRQIAVREDFKRGHSST